MVLNNVELLSALKNSTSRDLRRGVTNNPDDLNIWHYG
jgi:hypothetical protein